MNPIWENSFGTVVENLSPSYTLFRPHTNPLHKTSTRVLVFQWRSDEHSQCVFCEFAPKNRSISEMSKSLTRSLTRHRFIESTHGPQSITPRSPRSPLRTLSCARCSKRVRSGGSGATWGVRHIPPCGAVDLDQDVRVTTETGFIGL